MQIKSYSFLIRLVILLAFSLSFYSCGVWTNFTTYFNLYYDATDLFSQAEKDINTQRTDLFAEEEPAVSTTTSALLVKVEEKCSQILQFHAKSSYVDNSLFIIGKCFYYQGSYRKALRKFEELIATQPKSKLILQTRLWIGKNQMRLKEFDNSLATLKETRETAIKQGETEIAQDSYIEEIRYQIFKLDYPAAIDLAKNFLTISKDDELNSEVAFEIGKLYNKLNDYNNAIVYYRKVRDYSPTYNLRYSSLIEEGKALREIGQNDKALVIFNQLSREQKYVDVLDQIDFERGITYLKMDNLDKAVDLFIYVDTSFSKMPSAGKSAYVLGKIFLEKYKNFDSAAYYFNQVFSSTAPLEFVNLARNSSEQLRKYELLYLSVKDNYKQLNYALDSTAFVKDSIAYYTDLAKKTKTAKADSLKFKDEKSNRLANKTTARNEQTSAQKGQTGQQNPDQQQPGAQPQGQQTGQPPQNQQQLAQGQQPGLQQPGQQQSPQPNTSTQLLQWQQLKAQVKPPVRPILSIDSLTYYLVKSEYELGNLLIAEFNMPDSAYNYYSDINLNYPASPFEGRVVFAIGNYYLAINDTIKADSVFNVVYEKYRNESVVNNAALKLNKPMIDYNYDPAKELYVNAESMMSKSNYDSSIANMYKIYLTHSKSPIASKALYAIGWMLENKNLNDSAVVVYDTLIAKYPHSVYAADISPKVSFYKSELLRINKAKQDSLYALNNPKSNLVSKDSLLLKQQKSGKLADKTTGVNKGPENLKAGTNPNAAKAEDFIMNKNAVANPDTLIRIRGRGNRRIER
jgi:tetratricopeptide (TPR) repeat protein